MDTVSLSDSDAMPTIAVRDLVAARDFYEDTLGLTVQQEMPEAGVVVYKSGSGMVQVYQSEQAGTNRATYATWEVDDIEDVAAALRSKGVVFDHYPDMPDVTLDGDVHSWNGERAAWFRDPEGNILCLHESV